MVCTGRSERLQAIQIYVEDNLEWGELTPATVARVLEISVRQLHMLFESTGMTFSRYVLARRLERTRETLLLDPERKILDVAFSCGIRSSTVFYRGFHEKFDMNPTECRQLAFAAPPLMPPVCEMPSFNMMSDG